MRYMTDGSPIPDTAEELEELLAVEVPQAESDTSSDDLEAPPSLADLFDDVREAYCRYIGFASQAQSVALTLWTAHTHALEAADCTPYIRVYSAEKESGKTRTEEVAFHLVRGGVRASSVSASALFRLVDAHHPTLLVDEVDAIFAPKSEQEDLRSILNAGYERGNPVYRSVSVGKQWDATAYDAFCPKMLAGIENGRLPDTLVSRSIPIGLQRKRKDEPSVAKFRKRTDPPRLHALREALAAWATEDVVRSLVAAYPEPVPGLTDRQDDIWEPLLAIARCGRWGLAGARTCCGRRTSRRRPRERVLRRPSPRRHPRSRRSRRADLYVRSRNPPRQGWRSWSMGGLVGQVRGVGLGRLEEVRGSPDRPQAEAVWHQGKTGHR
jgi:hypothetical protein